MMVCRECRADMTHTYCESWAAYPDTGGVDEYVTMKGYWNCYACGSVVDEDDGDYYEPE